MKKLWAITGIIFVSGVVIVAYTGWNYLNFVNLKNQCLSRYNSGAYLKPSVVYLKIGVGADKLKMLSDYISSLNGVVSVQVVTAEQALDEFKVKNSNNGAVLDSLSKLQVNPFGAYIEIYLTNGTDTSLIKNSIELQASEMVIDRIDVPSVSEFKKSISDIKFDFIHQRASQRFFQYVPYCDNLSPTIF